VAVRPRRLLPPRARPSRRRPPLPPGRRPRPEASSSTAAAPPATRVPAQGAVATVPPTIAADCTRDVTGALNTWMASVADGSTLSFRAGACYRVDGSLVLKDRHDLTLDGNGASFTASEIPSTSPKITRRMWALVGGSDITMRNLTVRGTSPTATFDVRREWFPLIHISGTSKVLFERVHGSNAWGDFVSIAPDNRPQSRSNSTVGVLARDVTVRQSSPSVIGRHGVTCIGCEDVVIDGNTFDGIAYQVVDIEVEADTWYARNVSFTNNTIGKHRLSVLANAGIGRSVTEITLSGNTMTSAPVTCAPAIQIDDTVAVKSNWTITDNRFKTLGSAFWLRGVDNVTVGHNVVSLMAGGCQNQDTAIIASNSRGNDVSNNDFPGARVLHAGSTPPARPVGTGWPAQGSTSRSPAPPSDPVAGAGFGRLGRRGRGGTR
jgi:hypothetical protein